MKRNFTHLILWCSCAFIVVAITWAYFAKLDEVTSADGKIIPSQQVQVIQNLEGGIVKEVFVKEGEIVNQNQLLAQIDDIRFSSDYQEGKLEEFG